MKPVTRLLTLVQATSDQLRQAIQNGELSGLLPGELELCRRLRVSRVTMRGALARLEAEGLLRGSKGRRRQILQPGRSAPRAGSRPSRVVILSPSAWAGLTASKLLWIDELRDQLTSQGVGFDFVASAAAFLQRPGRILKDLAALHPDAVWLLLRSTDPMQRWFGAQRLPAVVAGSLFADSALPGVDSDYFAVCRHAAGLLLARGCQRLGLVIPQVSLAGDQESEAGFRKGAGQHPVCTARHDSTPDGLCRALVALMKQERPQGLLVFHATHAVSALGCLTTGGWRVPQDVRLLSRDDDPFLQHVIPRPARYSVAPGAYASKLARVILRWIEGEVPAPQAELILPEFTPGETV